MEKTTSEKVILSLALTVLILAVTTLSALAVEPIKMGVLVASTGAGAAGGDELVKGWTLWWKQRGTTVAGRPVQWFIEGTASTPDTALAKARLLVEGHGVHMLFGPQLANEGYAVGDYTKTKGIPHFAIIMASMDLTQRGRMPNVLRVAGWAASQTDHPFGEWVYAHGCKRVVTVAADYAHGHETTGGFVHTYTDLGGKVLDQLWAPINEADYGAYLPRIRALNPDCVFNSTVAASAATFIKQYKEAGLMDKIRLYLSELPTDQTSLRGLTPKEYGIGLISAGHYAEGRDAPGTREFVAAYDREYSRLPSYYAAASYTSARWVVEAIEKIKGNVEDREAFLKAVKDVELPDSPFGPLKLDEYGNPVFNVYIRRVDMRPDGRLWNVVTETIPNVSQFYKYNPQEFLKQPPYSRTYQGMASPSR